MLNGPGCSIDHTIHAAGLATTGIGHEQVIMTSQSPRLMSSQKSTRTMVACTSDIWLLHSSITLQLPVVDLDSRGVQHVHGPSMFHFCDDGERLLSSAFDKALLDWICHHMRGYSVICTLQQLSLKLCKLLCRVCTAFNLSFKLQEEGIW